MMILAMILELLHLVTAHWTFIEVIWILVSVLVVVLLVDLLVVASL